MPQQPGLPRTPIVEDLDDRLRGPGSVARIEAAELEALARETGLGEHALVAACLAWAQRWARAPLSSFEVGAAALGGSGALYLGANIEFAGLVLAHTVHAEQSAIAHAWTGGETRLRALATSAAPCGFCRQFMLELPDPPVLIVADPVPATIELAELIPAAFGPTQLGRTPQLLRAGPHGLGLASEDRDELAALALAAADRSSAPYTGALAGVAVETADGRRFAGAVAESAAYNPTLGPMQAAMIALHHGGATLESITRAALVELDGAPISQRSAAAAILASVAPNAELVRHPAINP